MQLQFFMDKFKSDIRALPNILANDGKVKVNVEDVQRVIERSELRLANESLVEENEARFQAILNKPERLTPSEFEEGVRLVMMVHMPLIRGENDVVGLRLRDADLLRLTNKLTGRDIEHGVDEYNEAYEELEAERERERQKKKEAAAEKRKQKQEAEKRKKEKEQQALLKSVRQELSDDI